MACKNWGQIGLTDQIQCCIDYNHIMVTKHEWTINNLLIFLLKSQKQKNIFVGSKLGEIIKSKWTKLFRT